MNFGSDEYINRFIKIINLSRVVLILGLLLKFLVVKECIDINAIFIMIPIILGGASLTLCYFLSVFEPLELKYDWSLVYPELRKYKKK